MRVTTIVRSLESQGVSFSLQNSEGERRCFMPSNRVLPTGAGGSFIPLAPDAEDCQESGSRLESQVRQAVEFSTGSDGYEVSSPVDTNSREHLRGDPGLASQIEEGVTTTGCFPRRKTHKKKTVANGQTSDTSGSSSKKRLSQEMSPITGVLSMGTVAVLPVSASAPKLR